MSDLVTGVLSLVEGMPLPEDRMLAFVEGAGVSGVGYLGCEGTGMRWYIERGVGA